MKTLFRIFFLMAVISIVAGCDKTDDLISDESVELKSAQPHEVTVPFEANLLGEITNVDFEAPECIDEGYAAHVIVEASGNATQMGKVSLTFNFCSGGAPDPDIEGSVYTYAGFTADLIAANGDVLFLSYSSGSAIGGRLAEHPDHVYEYWGGTVEVLGGTGKFEGAKGNLTADDYVSTLDDYTHHRFYGELILLKGKDH